MKELLIDLYKVKDVYSGLGQFSINFAKELMRQSPEDFNIIYLIPGNYELNDFTNSNLVRVNLQKRYLPMLNKPYDIWHGLQQFPSHFPNKKSIFILTVHDLNFLFEKNEVKRSGYLSRLQKNIDRADYITAISDFTKKNIEDHINLRGKKILTIYNGISIDTQGIGQKPNYVDEKKFFFSIGIFNKKKNFHTLLPIMNYFKDHKLIIAGNIDTHYGKQIQKQINDMNLAERVILPGMINDNEKSWLYRNCNAFLFPSLAEGFGMPVIEAMKFGKPVFLSNFTSLPEIGGGFAFYFENFNEEYMSAFIKNKLSYYKDNQLTLSEQIKEHAERFSWQTCIAQYIKLYQEIANEK
jgi:glycosyltransferase involved in cell wall biosynthesis